MTTTFDWDDYRLFHALAESGSVRGTAEKLGISHSTLSRRLDNLEANLSVQLFERSRRGFNLTEAGTILLQSTLAASQRLVDGQRRVSGLDQKMAGPIRVTMPDILAYYVLLPAIGTFQSAYPDVSLEIDISYVESNLQQRQADVAVRMVAIGASPPERLVGRKITQSYASGYATPAYLEQHDPQAKNSTARWLGWDGVSDSDWIEKTPYSHLRSIGQFNHAELQHHAAKQGLGIAYIPCALGGSDPDLIQLPLMSPIPARDIWVLTHEDLRDAARMKLFRDHIGKAVIASNDLLKGDL